MATFLFFCVDDNIHGSHTAACKYWYLIEKINKFHDWNFMYPFHLCKLLTSQTSIDNKSIEPELSVFTCCVYGCLPVYPLAYAVKAVATLSTGEPRSCVLKYSCCQSQTWICYPLSNPTAPLTYLSNRVDASSALSTEWEGPVIVSGGTLPRICLYISNIVWEPQPAAAQRRV